MNNFSHFNDTVPKTDYSPPMAAIRSYGTPRFGRSNNLVAAAFGTPEQQSSYITGLVLGAVVIIAIFIAWALATLILMCLGKRRVGFWAGAPFQETNSGRATNGHHDNDHVATVHADDDESLTPRKHYDEKHRHNNSKISYRNNHPFCWRILFLISGLLFIIFSILLLTKGVANLIETTNVLEHSLNELDTLASATQSVVNKLQLVANASDQIYGNLSNQVDGPSFCPSDPTLAGNNQVAQLQSQAETAVNELGQVNDVLGESFVGDLDAILKQYDSFANPINETLSDLKLDDWRATLPIVVVVIVVALLMLGTILAMLNLASHSRCYKAVFNYVLTPLLVLICVISWCVAAAMIMAAGVNGDFCLPGGRDSTPDETVLSMMDAAGLDASSANASSSSGDEFNSYAVASFYVQQCTVGQNPFGFVQASIPDLMAGQQSVAELESIFNNTQQMAVLGAYCGRDYTQVQDLLLTYVGFINNLLEASIRMLELISCETIVPIYVDTVYYGMCTYSPEAVYWVFKSALVMAIMSSIMLTLRASYKKTNVVHSFEDSDDVRRDGDVSIAGMVSPAKTNGNSSP